MSLWRGLRSIPETQDWAQHKTNIEPTCTGHKKEHFFPFSLNTLVKLFSSLQAGILTHISGRALPLLSVGEVGGKEISFPFSASSSGSLPQSQQVSCGLNRSYENLGFNTLSFHELSTNKTH